MNMNRILKDIKNGLLSFINFIANFFKEDKPEDLDKVIAMGIAIINSIYFLKAGFDNSLELNGNIVIGLYALALTGMVSTNLARRNKNR